jgi:hypothetical protein
MRVERPGHGRRLSPRQRAAASLYLAAVMASPAFENTPADAGGAVFLCDAREDAEAAREARSS